MEFQIDAKIKMAKKSIKIYIFITFNEAKYPKSRKRSPRVFKR